jgi:site-specific DNA recombinase
MKAAKPTTKPTRAVTYERFSPRPNAATCESIDFQLDRLRAWAKAFDVEIVADYADPDCSGGSIEGRPELEKALQHVCRIRGVLLVYSLSRLARETEDALKIAKRLRKAHANIVSLSERLDTTTPHGRFSFAVLAAVDQLVREQGNERTADAMLRHQSSGRRMSARPPYGMMVDPADPKRLVECPSERAVIQLIHGWHIDKRLSLRTIAATLQNLRCPARGPNGWTHTLVRRVLRREGLI